MDCKICGMDHEKEQREIKKEMRERIDQITDNMITELVKNALSDKDAEILRLTTTLHQFIKNSMFEVHRSLDRGYEFGMQDGIKKMGKVIGPVMNIMYHAKPLADTLSTARDTKNATALNTGDVERFLEAFEAVDIVELNVNAQSMH